MERRLLGHLPSSRPKTSKSPSASSSPSRICVPQWSKPDTIVSTTPFHPSSSTLRADRRALTAHNFPSSRFHKRTYTNTHRTKRDRREAYVCRCGGRAAVPVARAAQHAAVPAQPRRACRGAVLPARAPPVRQLLAPQARPAAGPAHARPGGGGGGRSRGKWVQSG